MEREARHPHPHDSAGVAAARERVLSLDDSTEVASLFRLLGDPTRARVASALGAVDELCVGDIALAIEANENTVPLCARTAADRQLVRSRRAGRIIYYRLVDERLRRLVELARP